MLDFIGGGVRVYAIVGRMQLIDARSFMKKLLLTVTLALGLIPAPASAVTYQHHYRRTYRTHRRVVVYRRSHKKSAAIVAGSAATGAAIGAIAGGGKGAGIGALVGGASGFIYDRATHKKVVTQ